MSGTPSEMIDIVVRAGAGAGKTTDLTKRVLDLAQAYREQEGRWPRFVVTTFTRKATQELRERLAMRAMERDQKNPALENEKKLLTFVKSTSHLHISTIHGVLGLFLLKYGSRMGLSPQVRFVSEAQERVQVKRALRKLVGQDPGLSELFQDLLEEFGYQKLLEMLHQSVKLNLQYPGMRPVSREKLEQAARAELRTLNVRAQEFASQVLESIDNDKWVEWARALSQVHLEESAGNLEEIENKIASLPPVRKTKDIPEEVADSKNQILKDLKGALKASRSRDFFENHEKMAQKFHQLSLSLSERVIQEKIEKSEMTMSDLELLSHKLIQDDPEGAKLFGALWNYWLVDEYQDTSPLQVKLLKALIGETPHFVVGDPQQSIYLFRGARSEVFIEKERWAEAHNGRLETKMENWRSFPETLEFFNELFVRLNPKQFQRMLPQEKERGPRLESEAAQVFIVPAKGSIAANDTEDLLEEEPQELMAQIFRCQELIKKGAKPESICILARKNDDLDQIAHLAGVYRLPVQVHSAGQFFERREVQDALALLKFLVNPHDNKNLILLLRSPMLRVSDALMIQWISEIPLVDRKKVSYWNSFCQKANTQIETLKSAISRAQAIGIGAAWSETLVATHFFDYSYQMDPTGRREANLWKLLSMVRSKERNPGFQYLDFIHNRLWMDLSSESGGGEADAVPVVEPQRVQLMTVHASKGLEFDHILLGGCGRFKPRQKPQALSFDEKTSEWTLSLVDPEDGKQISSILGEQIAAEKVVRELEEYDRQFYVALTRAKQTVSLFWNAKVDPKSWADRWPFEKTEGVHKEGKFSFAVRTGIFTPEVLPETITSSAHVKSPWTTDLQSPSRTVSVTEMLTAGSSLGTQVLKVESIQKALTGVQVHRLFENLKYHYLRSPEFKWQDLLPELDNSSQKALIYLCESDGGRWLRLIQGGDVEYGFGVLRDQNLIQGQIDLWGIDEEKKVWVVDYKTGSPEYRDKAFEQLKLYAMALCQMEKFKPDTVVNLAVIYPFAAKTYFETFQCEP